ncbi:MAG: aldo/keto reductase [Parachlamydiaceae bacterium]|nr:aldo/keto reductase [Parachlamydiaceae bacterium]
MHEKLPIQAVPPLIYGTAWKKDKTAELVEKAILCGFRGVDTACQPKHYYEAGVGQALLRLKEHGIFRDNLFLQTKFTPLSGQDSANIPFDPAASLDDQVRQSFACSQKNLGVETVDSLVLHSPLRSHEQTMQVWRAMEDLYKAGVVRMLGISNCYDLDVFKSIYDEAKVKPSVLQNRFYSETGYDQKLREWSGERGVCYQSFWTLTANPQILSHPLVRSLSVIKGVTEAQLFFRFLTHLKITPLIGSCSEKHTKEDLAIFDFTLSNAEIASIETLILSR